jgi:hypothetical protein
MTRFFRGAEELSANVRAIFFRKPKAKIQNQAKRTPNRPTAENNLTVSGARQPGRERKI